MIDLASLREEDKGRNVIYKPFEGCDNSLREEGHITSWNEIYIFVDYGHSCGRGIATSPNDLEFSFKG